MSRTVSSTAPDAKGTPDRTPARADGYAPIREYAALGDGRTVALVAGDGRIDWWPLPSMDSPPAFAAIIDAPDGGYVELQPETAFRVSRRYVGKSGVLESTFTTAGGTVRITDALTFGLSFGGLPWAELVRRIEAVEGEVPLRWKVAPGTRFNSVRPWIEPQDEKILIHVGDQVLAIHCVDVGEPAVGRSEVSGRFVARAGIDASFLALTSTDRTPAFFPPPRTFARRLARTIDDWHAWSSGVQAKGRWADAVSRSALALRMLMYAPTGAIAAAPTTSLPERIGGDKNWDYRYMWVRDASFTVDALINLDLHEEVQSAVSWLLHTVASTAPSLKVFYKLDGRTPDEQTTLDAPGYQGSRPVRSGNDAANQTQLGTFGDLFDSVWRYVQAGHLLDPGSGRMLADLADVCCDLWSTADAGIWELHTNRHYTISKIGCWTALDRAVRLHRRGQIATGHADRWSSERDAIKEWVDEHCWSQAKKSYTFYAGTEDLDAATLLAGRTGFDTGERLACTIDAVKRELADGSLVYRYSGMQHEEGAFVACSFWLVTALAIAGRRDDAVALMDDCVALTNDVGLLSEQIRPTDGAFLGNFPQGLSHLALINAASALTDGTP